MICGSNGVPKTESLRLLVSCPQTQHTIKTSSVARIGGHPNDADSALVYDHIPNPDILSDIRDAHQFHVTQS